MAAESGDDIWGTGKETLVIKAVNARDNGPSEGEPAEDPRRVFYVEVNGVGDGDDATERSTRREIPAVPMAKVGESDDRHSRPTRPVIPAIPAGVRRQLPDFENDRETRQVPAVDAAMAQRASLIDKYCGVEAATATQVCWRGADGAIVSDRARVIGVTYPDESGAQNFILQLRSESGPDSWQDDVVLVGLEELDELQTLASDVLALVGGKQEDRPVLRRPVPIDLAQGANHHCYMDNIEMSKQVLAVTSNATGQVLAYLVAHKGHLYAVDANQPYLQEIPVQARAGVRWCVFGHNAKPSRYDYPGRYSLPSLASGQDEEGKQPAVSSRDFLVALADDGYFHVYPSGEPARVSLSYVAGFAR